MKNLIERVLEDKPECMMKEVQDTRSFQDKLYLFASEICWNNEATINLSEVCGSCHPSYINKPWLYILLNAPRMKMNLQLFNENPDYYTSNAVKSPVMFFSKHDDVLYLKGDGNHRTAIAKAYFYYAGLDELKGVNLSEYVINHELCHNYKSLTDLLLSLKYQQLTCELLREHVAREDGAAWHKEKYDLKVKVLFPSKQKEILLSQYEISEFIGEIKSNPLLRMLRSNKYAKFLR